MVPVYLLVQAIDLLTTTTTHTITTSTTNYYCATTTLLKHLEGPLYIQADDHRSVFDGVVLLEGWRWAQVFLADSAHEASRLPL